MATLDLHFEAPAHHSPAHRTQFDRRKDDARFIFNKTIAGHYRHGRTGYNRVGVLLITWEQDDMHLKTSEANRLEKIFGHKFNFETRSFQIPSTKSDTGVLRAVTEFIDEYNSPDNLMIVYYGGHGYKGTETEQFKLAAKLEADGEGDPNAFFNDTFNCLRLPHADILFIVDCCYAARAFASEGLGRRKYELMAAAPPDGFVPSAKHNDSFTRRLCDTLEKMLSEVKHSRGFPTSELYRRVYHQIRADIKPFLFDQSLFDYGKIWIRPQEVLPQPVLRAKKLVTIDLTLRMTDMPSAAQINELARSLQYIPHVDEIKIGDMHAPAEEIQEFFFGMKRAMYIKKIMRRLRERIDKKNREHNVDHADPVMGRRLSIRTNVALDHYQSPDWSTSEAILRQGSKLPVSMATGKVAPRSPMSEESPFVEGPPQLELHSFLSVFSIAWSFHLDRFKNVWPSRPYRLALADTYGHGENGSVGQSSSGSYVRKRSSSIASVVFAAIAEHERRTQSLEVFMWIATVLGICVFLFASFSW